MCIHYRLCRYCSSVSKTTTPIRHYLHIHNIDSFIVRCETNRVNVIRFIDCEKCINFTRHHHGKHFLKQYTKIKCLSILINIRRSDWNVYGFFISHWQSQEVEETLKRIASHKGVVGTIVVNTEGVYNVPFECNCCSCSESNFPSALHQHTC